MKHGQPPSLGVLLVISSSRPTFPAALTHLRNRIELGAATYVYALDEGAAAIASPELIELSRDGLRLFCCSQAAERWSVPRHQEITLGGLGLLDDLIAATDRFLALTSAAPSLATIDREFPIESAPWPANTSRKVLVILDKPPENDPLAAEGLRVASGLAAGRRLRVSLAVRGLNATGNLKDQGWILDPVLAGYLDVIVGSDARLLAVMGEDGITGRRPCGRMPMPWITEDELAREAATAFTVLRF